MIKHLVGSHIKIAVESVGTAKGFQLRPVSATPLLLNAAENLAMAGLLSEGIERGFFWHAVSQADPLKRLLTLLPDECALKPDLACLLDLSATFANWRAGEFGETGPTMPSAAYLQECKDALGSAIARCYVAFHIHQERDRLVLVNLRPLRQLSSPS